MKVPRRREARPRRSVRAVGSNREDMGWGGEDAPVVEPHPLQCVGGVEEKRLAVRGRLWIRLPLDRAVGDERAGQLAAVGSMRCRPPLAGAISQRPSGVNTGGLNSSNV